MHYFASMLLKFSHHFKLQKHCYKQRQNAQFCVLAFSETDLSSNFKNIVSNSVKMYYLLSLLSTFSQHFQVPKTTFNQCQNTTFSVLSFKTFSAVSTLFHRALGNEQTYCQPNMNFTNKINTPPTPTTSAKICSCERSPWKVIRNEKTQNYFS